MSGRRPNPSRQDKPHPHSTFADPSGMYLLAPNLGADLIRVFSVDKSSGQLTQCTNVQAGAGDGPRHVAFWLPKPGSADGTIMYSVNELGNSVGVYQVTYPASGCLTARKV